MCRHAGSRPGAMEHVLSGQLHFYWPTTFSRQNHCHRFKINNCLTAKTSSDFSWNGLDVAGRHSSYRGCQIANHKLPLGTTPDCWLGIGFVAHETSLRLNIALMHCSRLIISLNNQIGFGKTCFNIAGFNRHNIRNIGRPFNTIGFQPVMQNRRVWRHRFVNVDNVRQHVVFDLNQFQRGISDGLRDGGYGRHGMPCVKDFFSCHTASGNPADIIWTLR